MNTSAKLAKTAVVKVSEIRGFMAKQRITGQDVEVSPPQLHRGTISSVWSDGTAIVNWDRGHVIDIERHLVRNGRVDLHYLSVVHQGTKPGLRQSLEVCAATLPCGHVSGGTRLR